MGYFSTTFGVLVLATPGARLELVLEGQCTRSKKAPSTRVHLAFARSNKLQPIKPVNILMRLLNIPNTEKTYSFMFLRQILSCYNLKIVRLLNS